MAAPLAGQVAIVSGAARGIGRAAAYRLANEGACVALFDKDAAAVQAAAESLKARGLRVMQYPVDVTDEAGLNEAVATVVKQDGRIDILVNNAGIYPHTPFGKVTFAEWRRVLATNLDGMYLCTRAVWPAMVNQSYGRLVNISSATFHIGYPEMVPYISSKGGVVGFTRGLAAEAGAHGITVNCITPGLIETEGTQVEDPTGELFEEIVGGQAVKRRGKPDDIAECIAYLASPAAGFITGQTINVDGGHRLY